MEIPFISSGASSRAHYALVRKIEYASSPRSANQHLSTAIEAARRQLAHPAVTLDEIRECLIVLFYCYMNVSYGFLVPDTFNFALSHAITLAEAGRTVAHKRMGYLFCAEVMPSDHELRLMLVNTMRKDLEHENIPRICLALESVITSSNGDLVPAVQSRVQDLLSHNSPHIRRRALLASRSLARHQPEWLSRISQTIVKRVGDPHPSVSNAALVLSAQLTEVQEPACNAQLVVNDMLKALSLDSSLYKPWFLVRILHAVFCLGLSEGNILTILELIHSSSKSHDRATLRGACLLLSKIAPKTLLSSVSVDFVSPVQGLRPFLTSRDPNDIYLFLSCLECIDPVLWGGTSPDAPAILDGWEVERIMQLLDSPDALIRRMTLRVLNRVDSGIVASYYSKAVENIPPRLPIDDVNRCAIRLTEIVETQSGADGELYAQELKDLLVHLEAAVSNVVLETVVEIVLSYFQNGNMNFRIGFPTAMLTFMVDSNSRLPQTMIVIIAALATEECGKLSVPPLDLLQGFASNLSSSLPSVKDTCLLAMMRIAANCNEIPSTIVQSVAELGQNSKRHIRRRCEQFISLVNDKAALASIVTKARSSSLPDFLAALEDRPGQRTPASRPSAPSSSQMLSASMLRYEAYDTPTPAPKLRTRDSSKSPYFSGSSRSEALSDTTSIGDSSHDLLSRVSSRLSVSSVDPLSRTMTPRELTLAANRQPEDMAKTPARLSTSQVEELASRIDLIALDSPFVSNPSEATVDEEANFGALWDSIEDGDARGWYNASIDIAVRRLQGFEHIQLQVISADLPPFIGDLKVILSSAHDTRPLAVLRLQESEEDSCLWRLRSSDARLRAQVRQLLTEIDQKVYID